MSHVGIVTAPQRHGVDVVTSIGLGGETYLIHHAGEVAALGGLATRLVDVGGCLGRR